MVGSKRVEDQLTPRTPREDPEKQAFLPADGKKPRSEVSLLNRICMGGNFFAYIQQLEMLAFFSGYAPVNYFVHFLSGTAFFKAARGAKLVSLLPFAYALLGTLYFGLQLLNLFPDYSLENIERRIQHPYLTVLGALSMLLWIPALPKRQIVSILHSFVFFLLITRDLFFHFTVSVLDPDIIKNDMKIYTLSIFLNLAAFLVLAFLSCLPPFRKKCPVS